ncbi:MAG: hypothetical protein ACYCY3_11280 [Halothiobacillus sp.]
MNTEEMFENAMLPEAAYADLAGVATQKALKDALTANDFSPTQAAKFVTQWRVVDHQPTNTSTGLSATLFERLDAAGT